MGGDRCDRWLCSPLNAHAVPEQWAHAEGCPLWPGVPPADGERLVFGVHRQTIAEAGSAPAWGGPDWVSQVQREARRRRDGS